MAQANAGGGSPVELGEFEDEMDVLDPTGESDPFAELSDTKETPEPEIVEDDEEEDVELEIVDETVEEEDEGDDEEDEDEPAEEPVAQAQPVDITQDPRFQEMARRERLANYNGIRAATKLREADLEKVKADLRDAKEEGDSDKEIEALGQFSRVQAEVGQLRTLEDQVKREIESNAPVAVQQAPAAAQPEAPKLTGEADAWVKKQAFFQNNDDDSMRIRALAMSIDNAMSGERQDTGSAAYMKELTKRINAASGKSVAVYSSGRKPATGQRKRGQGKPSPVAGGVAGNEGAKRKGVVAKYSGEEMRVLQSFGLDPKNPTHRKHMQRERQARMKREAQGDMA